MTEHEQIKANVFEDPCTPYFIKDTISLFDRKDIVDAMIALATLTQYLEAKQRDSRLLDLN